MCVGIGIERVSETKLQRLKVYGCDGEKWSVVGYSDEDRFRSMPWGWYETCKSGMHAVVGGGIGKQIHCPVCEPDWNWKEDWRNIWNQPSEYEKNKCI